MAEDHDEHVRSIAERVLEFADELEASGDASIKGDGLEKARAALHAWIDAMTGVVVTPALGRVTVIHGQGRESTISSPDLPFAMSTPLARTTPAEG